MKGEPKVLLVAYASYSRDARIKSYVRSLAARGVDHEVWTLREEGVTGPERVVRYSTKYQGGSAARYILSYLAFFARTLLRALARPARFDVVHCHNMPNFIVFAFVVNRLFGTRIVLDNHDVMPVVLTAKRELAPTHPAVRLLELEQRCSMAFADHVITADHNQKDYLVQRGVPERKISVVLNLPNPSIFVPGGAGRADDGEFRVVYHGTVAQRLGVDLAIRAVHRARGDVPGLRLHVVGDGDHLDRCVRLARELGVDDVVRFSGRFHPVEELPEILGGMDAGLVPNRSNPATERYMLPVKLLEYVYLGKPVIAPDLEIIRRYFDASMVRYFRPEDVDDLAAAIVELYRSPESRARLARAAQSFFGEHDWQQQQASYLDLLSTLSGAAPSSLRV